MKTLQVSSLFYDGKFRLVHSFGENFLFSHQSFYALCHLFSQVLCDYPVSNTQLLKLIINNDLESYKLYHKKNIKSDSGDELHP